MGPELRFVWLQTLFWQHSWHLTAKRFLPVDTSYSWLIALVIQSLGTSLSGGLLCHLREGVNFFWKGGSRSWAFRIAWIHFSNYPFLLRFCKITWVKAHFNTPRSFKAPSLQKAECNLKNISTSFKLYWCIQPMCHFFS